MNPSSPMNGGAVRRNLWSASAARRAGRRGFAGASTGFLTAVGFVLRANACDVIIYALAQVFLRLLSAAPKAGRSIPYSAA